MMALRESSPGRCKQAPDLIIVIGMAILEEGQSVRSNITLR